jgi:hypothetical protein
MGDRCARQHRAPKRGKIFARKFFRRINRLTSPIRAFPPCKKRCSRPFARDRSSQKFQKFCDCEIARRINLLSPHNRVFEPWLLFEANATMTTLPPSPDPKWDYRRGAIARVLNAARLCVIDKAALRREHSEICVLENTCRKAGNSSIVRRDNRRRSPVILPVIGLFFTCYLPVLRNRHSDAIAQQIRVSFGILPC